MKDYFDTVLTNLVKPPGIEDTYLNVLTRTSVRGIYVGHPGVVSKYQYDKWL